MVFNGVEIQLRDLEIQKAFIKHYLKKLHD